MFLLVVRNIGQTSTCTCWHGVSLQNSVRSPGRFPRKKRQDAAKDALKSCNSAKKDSFGGAWVSGLQDNRGATELVADQVVVCLCSILVCLIYVHFDFSVFFFCSFTCWWLVVSYLLLDLFKLFAKLIISAAYPNNPCVI